MRAAQLNSHEAIHDHVCSTDSARIGFTRLGSGPPIVFVHGSLSQGLDWLPVAGYLAQDYTCYLMDRRGYGLSDFGRDPYCIDREYDDVMSVLSFAGRDAALVGHSYGAICCLGAAMLTSVPRLVVYEPPLPLHGPIAGQNLAPYCHAMRNGRFDEALEIGLKEFIRLPLDQIESIRGTAAWSRLFSLMSAWARELEALDAIASDVEVYAAIKCPTLLVRGTRSPTHPFQKAVSALSFSLPNASIAKLKGQGHLGLRSAPALLARQIKQFLCD